jgi:hypothetical protein
MKVVMLSLALFGLVSTAYAQDDLSQSIGPDVALLPPSSAALPFTSPETAFVLAQQAPVGSAPVAAPPIGKVPVPQGVPNGVPISCGGGDGSSCLQAAVNSNTDIVITSSLVAHGVHVPSGRNIQCSNNLVEIHNPIWTGGANDSTLIYDNTSGGSLRNCLLSGANSVVAPRYSRSGEFVFLVLTHNANNLVIQGNRLQGCAGDACIELSPGGAPPSRNITITGNNCNGSGLYCVAVVSGLNIQITNNYATDASIGFEQDGPTGQYAAGLIQGNTVKCTNGPTSAGDKALNPNCFLTGGAAAGGNYSQVVVKGNTLIGAPLVKDAGTGAAIAQYQ